MSFFSDGADAADADDARGVGDEDMPVATPPWEGPPQTEIPVLLPVATLITANAHAALVLSGARVHSTGVELDIETKVRRGTLAEEDWDDLLERTQGFGHRRARRITASGRLRIGIALPDGSRVLADGSGPGGEEEPSGPRLSRTGGSGSGSDRFWVSRWRFWLWPLPADGPLTVVADWPQLDLAEGSVVVDGSALAAAASSVGRIWSDPDPSHRGPHPSWSISFSTRTRQAPAPVRPDGEIRPPA